MRTGKRVSLRLLSLLMAVCLCLGAFWMSAPSTAEPVRADETSDLQQRNQELETQRQQAQQQIDQLQQQIDQQQAVQDDLQSQIDAVQQQVTLYQEQIDGLDVQIQEQNDRIDSLNMQLEQSQQRREEVENLFHDRMLALYLEGNTSTLELLLGAKSYADFLTRSQYVDSLAASDQAMLDELLQLENQINADMAEVEATRSSLEANQAQVQSLKAEQDAKIAELDTLQSQSESAEAQLQSSQDSLLSDVAQYQAEIAANNAQIEEIARANSSKVDNSTIQPDNGTYLWPCASHTISSPYGYRWGSMHRGIDISAPTGTPIYASRSGVVVVSMMGYSGSGFGGYGNVIMIQHDDGTYTMYAHCQSRYVSVGETVEQGQVIAGVGSTGNSTGNHLHFEIRMGVSSSTTVNPMNYF